MLISEHVRGGGKGTIMSDEGNKLGSDDFEIMLRKCSLYVARP
jgi:hypothetical protein